MASGDDHDDEGHGTRETVPLGERRPRARLPSLRKGTMVGRYRVLGRLGVGGVSMVYAAYDPALERRVAIKLLRTARARLPRARRRLLREAKAIARLSHPNIVSVHDVGVHESQLYVAMELVEGQTLRRWQQTPHPWREVLGVYLEAGRGLVAAHRAGVVHRDFKPDNAVVGDDGCVRVLDFGLAASHTPGSDIESSVDDERVADTSTPGDQATDEETLEEADTDADSQPSGAADSEDVQAAPEPAWEQATQLKPMRITATGVVMGTPNYMSPEQHNAEQTDARTDQYSFCVALYEALYGVRPFGDDDSEPSVDQLGQLKAAGAVCDPPAGSNVPARIRRILLRGLASRPADRWPAMDVLLLQLSRDPEAARRRWLMGLGAAAALAAAVALVTARLSSDSGPLVCQDGTDHLRGVWDDESRRATRAAFVATGAPYAATTLARVESTLDEYAASWVAGYEQACRDTRVHEVQSELLLDRRMACLQVRLARVRALTRAFAAADSRTVLNAAAVVMSLPDVDLCADAAQMIASAPLPEEQEARKAVRSLRERLAESAVMRDAGRDGEALALAQQIAAQASAVDYLPIEAEAQLMLGTLHHMAGDTNAAFSALEAAVWAAEASSHDHIAARGWVRAVHVAPLEMREMAARRAEAAIVRAGLDDLRASLASGVGAGYLLRGNYEDALASFQEALRLAREHGEGTYKQSLQVNNIAAVLSRMGRHDEALDRYQQAYEHVKEALGEDHPAVGFLLNNVGGTLIDLGRYDEAEAALIRALPLSEARGEDHRQLAFSLLSLGWLRFHQQRFAEAQTYLARSLAVWEALGLEEHSRPLCALGVLAEARGDYREARDLLERATAVEAEEGGPEHPDLVRARSFLGRVLVRLGDLARAEEVLAQVREAHESGTARRADRGLLACAQGLLAERRRRWDRALARYLEALETDERVYGEEHPTLVASLLAIGRSHLARNRPTDAIPPFRRALRICEKAKCPPRTQARAALLLARALAATGERQAAAEFARSAKSALARARERGAHPDDDGLERAAAGLSRSGP